jgi:hypothetical protein
MLTEKYKIDEETKHVKQFIQIFIKLLDTFLFYLS